MVYSFARIGAAIGMRVEDVYTQNRRLWLRLQEKGGKQHAMPCHHNLEAYLHGYLGGAGLANEPKAILFQTYSRSSGQLTGNPLLQANAYAMIQRRAKAAFPVIWGMPVKGSSTVRERPLRTILAYLFGRAI